MAYDTNDVVEEFGATFRFNYMTINTTSGTSRSIGTSGRQAPLPPLTTGARGADYVPSYSSSGNLPSDSVVNAPPAGSGIG